MRMEARTGIKALLAGFGFRDFELIQFQMTAKHAANCRFIINHQDTRGHGYHLDLVLCFDLLIRKCQCKARSMRLDIFHLYLAFMRIHNAFYDR
ncbi:hypothetical protein D3C87_1245600 [compost metagenome]